MEMKRIGILTYWGVPNYGAWAQAYALNNTVKNLMPEDEVKHISYLTPVHHDLYYKNDERLENSFSYSYCQISHTERYDFKELEQSKFDVIITGSDAIWEFNVPEMGNDRHLIGNNLNTDKLISYAASFGCMGFGDKFEEWMQEGLQKYFAISVRDKNSADMVEKHIGKRPEIVLDPVFLWDFKNDKNIMKPLYQSYIAVYGIQWDDEFIIEAKKFARDKKCKLISIGFINDWCDMSLKIIELRGNEWIGMIENAEYVFTSTFHGLMMSIIFEKQFKFDRVPYVENRSESLLQNLQGGTGIYIDDKKDFKTIFERKLDYTVISKNVNKLKNDSLEYLKETLNDEVK
ncbi:polysaccharide pyruvyl transferase family protein [Thermoguttaceae bacterium LCP21S3_D4]